MYGYPYEYPHNIIIRDRQNADTKDEKQAGEVLNGLKTMCNQESQTCTYGGGYKGEMTYDAESPRCHSQILQVDGSAYRSTNLGSRPPLPQNREINGLGQEWPPQIPAGDSSFKRALHGAP